MADEPRPDPDRETDGQFPTSTGWRRWRELPYLLVLGGVAFGVLVTGLHHFKRGGVIMGAALVLGAVLRLVLPEWRVGMLAVRGRALDAVTLLALGILIAVAAAIVPPP